MEKKQERHVKKRLIQELTIYEEFNDDKDSQRFCCEMFQ